MIYPEYSKPAHFGFPQGSIFTSESDLFLCYNGQTSSECEIGTLEIFFDCAGYYTISSLNQGFHGCVTFKILLT